MLGKIHSRTTAATTRTKHDQCGISLASAVGLIRNCAANRSLWRKPCAIAQGSTENGARYLAVWCVCRRGSSFSHLRTLGNTNGGRSVLFLRDIPRPCWLIRASHLCALAERRYKDDLVSSCAESFRLASWVTSGFGLLRPAACMPGYSFVLPGLERVVSNQS